MRRRGLCLLLLLGSVIPVAAQVSFSRINSLPLRSSPASTDSIVLQAANAPTDDGVTYRYSFSSLAAGLLPSQTGNSGKYLTTNGTTASWATVDALPTQTGNSGKYLTTNGTAASWGAFTGTFASLTGKPTTFSGYAISDTIANLKTALSDETAAGWNLFSLANPSAITFLKINADNSVSTESAATFRTSIGATTVGGNIFTLTNPSAISFLQINADNTVTALGLGSTGVAVLGSANATTGRNALGATSGIWAVNQGGNGTGTPALTAGTGIGITGSWGANTIAIASTAITGQTEDTAPASGDFLLSYDISASTLKKITLANLASALTITGVTDATSGFTATFDTTALTANQQFKFANGTSVSVLPASGTTSAPYVTGIDSGGNLLFGGEISPQTLTDADQSLTAGNTFFYVPSTTTITTTRAKTVPSATNYTTGRSITIADGSGTVSSTTALNVTPFSGETINGSSSAVPVSLAYGSMVLRKVGNTAWETVPTPTTTGQALTQATSAANARSLLNLGSASIQNTGTSGANIPMLNASNSWIAGQTQHFGANATAAGINLTGVTTDPSSLAGGDIWFRTDVPALKYYDGTSARTIITSASIGVSGGVEAWDTDLDTWATKTAPTGTVVGTSDSQSLTNKKLGSLTSNGFVKTSAGDGTLSVDTNTYALISDTAFASSWNGVTDTAPTKNAVYDYLHIGDTDDDGKIDVLDMGAGIVKTNSSGVPSAASLGTDYLDSTYISDTAFANTWNGVTTIAPTKNAIYDQLHLFDTDDDGKVDVLDVGAGIVKTDSGGVPSVVTAPTGTIVGTSDSQTLTNKTIDGASNTISNALTEASEANSNPIGDDGSTITPGMSTQRMFDTFTLPSTEKFYIITGIEWKNGATVNSSSQCGVSLVDSTTPSSASTSEVAWGMPVTNSGANSVQRNSSISSTPIRGGTVCAVWVQSGGTTHTYKGSAVSSINAKKTITFGTQNIVDTTAWAALTTQPYLKVYYRGYK